MLLKVFIDEHEDVIKVPDNIINDAADYFNMMDADMNRGYQMSRSWVESPDLYQKCQIAADHILTALETHNDKTATLMAAYILNRVPNAREIHLALTGDMHEHEIVA
jgi:hypothetical protein